MQLETNRSARSSLIWVGQAVSGVLLIIILLLHMYFHHFATGGMLNVNEVIAHVARPAIFILEILFIPVVTYHALLGIRAVIFDLNLSEIARRRVSIGLTVLGLVTVIYGVVLAFLIRSQLPI